MVIVIV